MGSDTGHANQKSRFHRLPGWYWILLLGIMAIVVPIAIYTGPLFVRAAHETKPVSNLLSEYSAALIRHDYSRAYSLCSEEFRQAMSEKAFAQQQERLEQKYGRLKSVQMRGTEIAVHYSKSEWRADVTMKFEFERRVIEFMYALNHTSGNWAIYGYRETTDNR